MTDFNWCHGPNCHTNKTLDRVRGVKGQKVLRTRKVQINIGIEIVSIPSFVVMVVIMNLPNKYVNEITAIAPRLDCLETPIDNPKRETQTTNYGYNYTTTTINVRE